MVRLCGSYLAQQWSESATISIKPKCQQLKRILKMCVMSAQLRTSGPVAGADSWVSRLLGWFWFIINLWILYQFSKFYCWTDKNGWETFIWILNRISNSSTLLIGNIIHLHRLMNWRCRERHMHWLVDVSPNRTPMIASPLYSMIYILLMESRGRY